MTNELAPIQELFHINVELITHLNHVRKESNEAMMVKTGIKSSTWYRIMKSPKNITIQQIVSIANALHIPVRRLFLSDGGEEKFKEGDTIEYTDKQCRYDFDTLQTIIANRKDVSWEKVADVANVSRSNIRNSLLSSTRLPAQRFLDICTAFNIDPFSVLIEERPLPAASKADELHSTNKAYPSVVESTPVDIETLYREIIRMRADISDIRRDIANLGEKFSGFIQTHNAVEK